MTDRASPAASVAGGIAIAIAPIALGAMSDTVGFHVAFLLVPVLLTVALGLVLMHPVADDAPLRPGLPPQLPR